VTAAATLRLSRQDGGSDNSHNGRAWQVTIDDSVVAAITKNETVDLPLEAGRHYLQVTSMRTHVSPVECLEVEEGQVIELSCRPRARHPFIVQRSMFFLVVSLFKHDVWISLTPGKTDPDAGRNGDRPPTDAAAASRPPASARAITDVKEISSAPTLEGQGGPPALAVRHLTKRFGTRTAFSDVSFEVACALRV
jgi:hypothetical protein